MNKVMLLEGLRCATLEAIGELLMPAKPQREDVETPRPCPAGVYLMRLPDGASATKKAPYILHQVVTGRDVQPAGKAVSASAVVRTVFCVYHDDGQEGGLMLLNLMERLRIHLLKQGIIGRQFRLDLSSGLEYMIYPDDTAPYYMGEMSSAWTLPPVEREVCL